VKAAGREKAIAEQRARAQKFDALEVAQRCLILNHLTCISSEAAQSATDFIDALEGEVRGKLVDAVEEFGKDIVLAAFETGRIPDIVSTDAAFSTKRLVEEGR
jgi:hypothetical protein